MDFFDLKKAFWAQQNSDVPIPTDHLLFHASFSSSKTTAETGQTLQVLGAGAYAIKTLDGVRCLHFDPAYNSGVKIVSAGFDAVLGTNPRTISGWARCDNASANTPLQILDYGLAGDGELFGLRVYHQGNVTFGLYCYNANFTFAIKSEVSDFSPYTWHHYCGRYADGIASIYVDGVCVKTGAHVINTKKNINNSKLGRCNSSTEADNGALAGVRLYSRALSDAEIIALAHEYHPTA